MDAKNCSKLTDQVSSGLLADGDDGEGDDEREGDDDNDDDNGRREFLLGEASGAISFFGSFSHSTSSLSPFPCVSDKSAPTKLRFKDLANALLGQDIKRVL